MSLAKSLSEPRFQVDALDGLRGLAALVVVFSHTSNYGMYFLPGLNLHGIGKSGVFLFFLLSAYLLSLPLLAKGRQVLSAPVMSHYWQRRFFRIYPLYSLYLLCGVASTWLATEWLGKRHLALPFPLDWGEFIAHLGLVAGKGVTWSIAVEFKFYFFLPLIILALVILRRFGRIAPIIALLLGIIGFQLLLPQQSTLVNDIRLLAYISIFLVGILLAYVQHEFGTVLGESRLWTRLLPVVGLCGVLGVTLMSPLGWSTFVAPVEKTEFHKDFLQYSFFWACILLCCVSGKGWLRRFFSWPALRFFGAISFSLYLFHVPVILLAGHLQIQGALGAWLVLLVSSFAAWCSFVLLEKPLSQFKFGQKKAAPEGGP